MFKLDLDKTEEPEIKLPTSTGSLKKQKKKKLEKHLLLLYWLHQSLWLSGSKQILENSERDGNTRPPELPPEKCVFKQAYDTTLMAESKEELKSLLMKVKEEREKIGLKLNIHKTKITASGPITSWQIDGKTIETVRDFIFWGSKITADGDCSHEIKRHLLLGRKATTNIDSMWKSRDIALPAKVCLVKVLVFPVVMYGCETWTIKKAECQSIDAFELWCWRRLLRVPRTARRSNQLILKEINPEYSLEGLMLKLKLQSFVYLMQRADSLEKALMLGKTEGKRRRGWQRMRCLDGITDSVNMSLSKFQRWWRTGKPGELQSIVLQRVKHNWATEQ